MSVSVGTSREEGTAERVRPYAEITADGHVGVHHASYCGEGHDDDFACTCGAETLGLMAAGARIRSLLSELSSLRESLEGVKQGSWTGTWENWIAPFSACPRCRASLNWQQKTNVLDRPVVVAECCGVAFGAELAWKVSDFAPSSGAVSSSDTERGES